MLCHCGRPTLIVRQVPDFGVVTRLRRCELDHTFVTLEGEITALLTGKLLALKEVEPFSLTTRDVASLLGVSRQTVLKHAKRGTILGIKIDHDWRFRPSIISAYILTRMNSHDSEDH